MAFRQKTDKQGDKFIRGNIQMFDLKAQYKELKPEIEEVLKEILESGCFVLGPHVKALEKEVSEYHNVKYAVSLASGTDALHLSLMAMGLKKGDEVITTPFTFIATAEAITYVGATPVFVDIDEHTLNIDPEKIKEKIGPKTRAIIPVHIFGYPAEMDDIMAIARHHDLKVIEDSAQSFGAEYKGVPAGSIGDAGCFSFYPSKNLGGYGDGGMVITNDQDIYEKIKLLRNHGATGSYKHSFIGFNSRLDEIQAAILRIKLKRVDVYNQKRRNLAGIYSSILQKVPNDVKCPSESPSIKHVYHQYTIRSPQRSAIQEILKKNSISSIVYYPVPLHLQEAFRYLGYKENDLPVSESVTRNVLSLPMYPELEEEKAVFVAENVVKAVR
jgi:dTDP-4-amino-4,6-dideoxygalactose transaminase